MRYIEHLIGAQRGDRPTYPGFPSDAELLSVTRFGARGDNASDNTAALNRAHAEAYGLHRPLWIPPGIYRVSDSIINRGVPVFGAGRFQSVIAPSAAFPGASNLYVVNPLSGVDVEFLYLRDFGIWPGIDGPLRGKHGIHILIDGITNMKRLVMWGIYVTPGNDYSLRIENNPALNLQGCPSNSLISECSFFEGIQATFIGDSVIVSHNDLRSTSTRLGLLAYLTDTSGVAGLLSFRENNVDCAGGAISVQRGTNIKVIDNNIEQSAGAGTNGAVVDISGSSGAIDTADVTGNKIDIFGTAAVNKAIRLDGVNDAFVDRNDMNAAVTVTDAIHITANANRTQLGRNPTTGSFTNKVTNNGAGTKPTLEDAPAPATGRLTLVSGSPVMTTSQSAKTSIFWTPRGGAHFPWFDGVFTTMVNSGEISLALDSNAGHTGYHQSGKLFDLFLENTTGTPRLVSGPAWTNDTTRASAVAYKNGFRTNSGATTVRFGTNSGDTLSLGANLGTFVGTFRASADGQTEFVFGALAASGTAGSFLLWNEFNRVLTKAMVRDTADSWNLASAAIRSANNSATMRVSFVTGAQEDFVEATYQSTATPGAGGVAAVGVGLDTTTAFTGIIGSVNNNGLQHAPRGHDTAQVLGFHFYQAIEAAQVAGTATFFGDNGTPTYYQNGLMVSLVM